MTYSLHPGAEQDITDAANFYAGVAGSAIAQRFVSEFERIASLVALHPGIGTPSGNGRRVFPMQVFPYAIVYREVEVGVRIIVVRHQHRRPGFSASRR